MIGANMPSRQYQEMWEIIRNLHRTKGAGCYIDINCPQSEVRNLKRMLAKEKDMDQSWPEKRFWKLTGKPLMYENGEVYAVRFQLEKYRIAEATGIFLKEDKISKR